MANFKTHFTIAAAASAMGATTLLGANIITADTAIYLTLSGTIGGLLPDVDSDHSQNSMGRLNLMITRHPVRLVRQSVSRPIHKKQLINR